MRKTIIAAITLILTAGLILTTIPVTMATLGPVHVELNMTKPKIAAARANTLTAFKVYMRYNVNIKIHDWLKIWFPIDEAVSATNAELVKQICDGLPPVTGQKENIRFIPNENYFKKYTNQEEKELGKVYAVKDEKGATEFDETPACSKDSVPGWASVCDATQGRVRIIKDPSGLGCWQMGTVFPPLPRDQTQRMERMKTIIRSTSIGYSPCSECQGYPILINNCKERSYQVNTPLEIEAWRKGYNSIDINTSKNTGLIAPATPGRYRLSIATLPEPTPVESEAFMLPCSDISNVNVILDPPDNDQVTNASIKFKTGEGGALDGGSSTIMIKFPKSFTLPKKFPAKSIKINGSFVSSAPQIATNNETFNQITLVVPTDIANLGDATIQFLEIGGIKNPSATGDNTIEISSSSEPNYIRSANFRIGAVASVKVTPNFEKATAAYTAVGILPADLKIKAGATFSVIFPATTALPTKIDSKNVEVGGKAYTGAIAISGNSVTLTATEEITGSLRIKFKSEAGIRNPVPGTYTLKFSYDSKEYSFENFDIIKSMPLVSDLELTDYQGSVASGYKFKYQPSAGGELSVGEKIHIVFPEGTTVPPTIAPENVYVCMKPVTEVVVVGQKVTITTDSNCKPFEWSIVEFKAQAGIKNPRKHGPYNLSVSTDKDEPITSEEYVIEPSPLKSWIYFKDPDKPNCGEWFNKPPILGFECLNPEAKLTFWFNNQPDKEVIYGGEARMMPGSQRAKITWQAEFNGIKEDPQTVDFYLDTISPPIKVDEPKSDSIRVSKKTYTVEGERGFTEMLTDGDNERFQVTDSVFIRFGGQETQLLTGEIYETANSGSITYKFKHTVNLKEGANVVEFIGRDQACNETIVRKTIILDTTPPNIEVVAPTANDVFAPDDATTIKVKTEQTATVYINGSIANLESNEGDQGIFTLDYTVVEGKNTITIEASDEAGNKSTKTITFEAKPKKTIIVLTMDKKDWTVNGATQAPLKAAPINKFTDPKLKALNGTTYMPIAQVAPFLNCKVDWLAKEKKVTLTQTLPNGSTKVVELWINKTKAKVDGKEVTFNAKGTLYPAVIGGNTCLPFRWFAETLGGKVDFDAKTKVITITYPL